VTSNQTMVTMYAVWCGHRCNRRHSRLVCLSSVVVWRSRTLPNANNHDVILVDNEAMATMALPRIEYSRRLPKEATSDCVMVVNYNVSV